MFFDNIKNITKGFEIVLNDIVAPVIIDFDTEKIDKDKDDMDEDVDNKSPLAKATQEEVDAFIEELDWEFRIYGDYLMEGER